MEKSTPSLTPGNNAAEFTKRAIVLGLVLAVLLGAANTYLGLYAGMTVSASIPAAVISMGILRGVLNRGTILENNIVQTIASTGESLAAGIIFTMPALVIAGIWSGFDYWTVTCVGMFGGVLGVLFMVPMRQSLIVEATMLKYPEGTACAEVLRVGETGSAGLYDIGLGVILGGGLKSLISGVALFKGTIEVAGRAAGSVFYFGSDMSGALLAVGAIVGFNVAALIFTGGALGWLVGIPLLSIFEGSPDGASVDAAWTLWSTRIRYAGVGAMVVSGVWSIIKIRSGIAAGLKSILGGYAKESKDLERTEQTMSSKSIFIIFALLLGSMVFFYVLRFQAIGITTISVILIVGLSFFLVAVASYICGLVGSSNNPVSGMTICALLVTALVFYTLGMRGTIAITATLLVAGVICCAACTSGDISQDLKTGLIVGATPRRQQWAEILGVVVPAFFFAPILVRLHAAYGIGTGAPGSLKAPQAVLFASLMDGIFGDGSMPWDMVAVGAVLAIAVICFDEYLGSRGKTFRLYPMPLAVGIYLPLSLVVPIFLGGLIQVFVKRSLQRRGLDAENGLQPVVLLSSGLIAGEALMGILIAFVIGIVGYFQIGLVIPLSLGLPEFPRVSITLLVFLFLIVLLARKGSGAGDKRRVL